MNPIILSATINFLVYGLTTGALVCYLESNPRDKFSAHSLLLYLLNVAVNVPPGMLVVLIYFISLLWPDIEIYLSGYLDDPWIMIGLERLPRVPSRWPFAGPSNR